jgi:hypothetical protein
MAEELPTVETPEVIEAAPVAPPPINIAAVNTKLEFEKLKEELMKPVGDGATVVASEKSDPDIRQLAKQVDAAKTDAEGNLKGDGLDPDIWRADYQPKGADTQAADDEASAAAAQVAADEAAKAAAVTATVDPVEDLALALRAKTPSLSLKVALDLAEKALNIAAPAATEKIDAAPELPGAQALQAELVKIEREEMRALDKELRQALRDYAADDVIDAIEARRTALEATADQIRADIPVAQQQEQARFDTLAAEMKQVGDRAVKAFPRLADPKDPLTLRCNEIHADLQRLGSPLVNAPDKAMRIALMASAELNIAPLSESRQVAAPAGTAKPAAIPVRTAVRNPVSMTAPIAPAGSRTSNTQPAIITEIQAIRGVDDYEAMTSKLFSRRR